MIVEGRTADGVGQEVRAPYSGELLGTVPTVGTEQVLAAIDGAACAMRAGLALHARAEILERAARLIGDRSERLARTVALEAGKPISLARAEAARAATTMQMSAVEARKLAGVALPLDATAAGAGRLGLTLRVPAGVVGAITPFNFPLNLAAHKIGPALAAGCAVVHKPSEKTPLSALALAEVLRDAGLPDGWLTVVVGEPEEIVGTFLADPRVAVMTFTGSSQVGWKLRERAPRKHVMLELGSSTPAIVEPGADLERAARELAVSAFAFAGQSCISAQRVFAHRDIAGEFTEALVAEARALPIGDPEDDAVLVGPLITPAARDRVLETVGHAVAAGASALTGGTADGGGVVPTVLVGTTADMAVRRGEIFGPVVSVASYDDLDEAVALANDSPYGLQAAIYTPDVQRALDAARRLEVGGVMINESPTFRPDQMPYGGIKESGNTKEGPASAVLEMTEERVVVIGA